MDWVQFNQFISVNYLTCSYYWRLLICLLDLKKQNNVTISRGSNFIAMKLDMASTQDNIFVFFSIYYTYTKEQKKYIFFLPGYSSMCVKFILSNKI